MTGVSVVLPVYRNAETLEELHARLCTALSTEDFELIFVNDACPAGSAKAPATRPYLKMGLTRIPPPSQTRFA